MVHLQLYVVYFDREEFFEDLKLLCRLRECPRRNIQLGERLLDSLQPTAELLLVGDEAGADGVQELVHLAGRAHLAEALQQRRHLLQFRREVLVNLRLLRLCSKAGGGVCLGNRGTPGGAIDHLELVVRLRQIERRNRVCRAAASHGTRQPGLGILERTVLRHRVQVLQLILSCLVL